MFGTKGFASEYEVFQIRDKIGEVTGIEMLCDDIGEDKDFNMMIIRGQKNIRETATRYDGLFYLVSCDQEYSEAGFGVEYLNEPGKGEVKSGNSVSFWRINGSKHATLTFIPTLGEEFLFTMTSISFISAGG